MTSKTKTDRQRESRLGIGSSTAALAVFFLMGIVLVASTPAQAGKRTGPPAVNKDNQDCADVAKSQNLACLNSAQDDYWVAIARCDNAAEEDTAGACPAAAAADRNDAKQNCADQLSARRDVCTQLGGGKYDPPLDPAKFSTKIDNPYFPLKPGTEFVYEGSTPDGHEHEEMLVTHNTHQFLGVNCVEVRDRSWINGALEEDTLDWYAQDTAGNVWYFGEQALQYSDGIIVANDGSWQTGADGAWPGIVMEASPAVGDVYRQEYAISEAEDMADVSGLGTSENVPYTGPFNNALQTHEFSGLEPSANEHKYYVPNVGNVLTVDEETGDRTELTEVHTGL